MRRVPSRKTHSQADPRPDKKPKQAKPGRFQSEAIERLRQDLSKLGVQSTRFRVPKDFATAMRDESMTVTHHYSQRSQGRPKGITKSTAAKLERIARLEADGFSRYAIAEQISMDYDDLRKFLHRNREAFQQIKQHAQ